MVQPGAAGLAAPSCRPQDAGGRHSEGLSASDGRRRDLLDTRVTTQDGGGRGGAGRRGGVVFESLDSRILEEALVSAMGRLGLGVRCRSRYG